MSSTMKHLKILLTAFLKMKQDKVSGAVLQLDLYEIYLLVPISDIDSDRVISNHQTITVVILLIR